jgi:hypothetical protein
VTGHPGGGCAGRGGRAPQDRATETVTEGNGRRHPWTTWTTSSKSSRQEHLGGATGDEEMQAEGEKKQLTGNLKQAGDKIEDAFRS